MHILSTYTAICGWRLLESLKKIVSKLISNHCLTEIVHQSRLFLTACPLFRGRGTEAGPFPVAEYLLF